jgi:hypothetical protein
VARANGKYFALAGEIDSRSLEIHEILVAPDRTIKLGPHRPIEFPDGFVPAVLHGTDTRLLVGGAKVVEAQRISVDYSVSPSLLASPYLVGYNPPYPDGVHDVSIPSLRPALFEISGKRLNELAIGDVADQVGWGTITDLVNVPGNGLAMRIEGSLSHEAAYGERVVIAETVDGGATWFSDTVANGLGEGWLGGLAVSGDAMVTITVDQAEKRTVYQRTVGTRTPYTKVDAGGGGLVLGAVASRGGSVVVFGSADGRVVRQRYETTTRQWIPAATDAAAGNTTHAVMTIGGAPDEWLAIGQGSARLINETD